jgi:hypothetical protein
MSKTSGHQFLQIGRFSWIRDTVHVLVCIATPSRGLILGVLLFEMPLLSRDVVDKLSIITVMKQ